MTQLNLPTVYDLHFRKEAYKKVKGKFVLDEETTAKLPDTPPQMTPLRGTYQVVSKEACRLNDVQFRSGFQHYLFFPEPAPTVDAA